jgi:hypothetical protein
LDLGSLLSNGNPLSLNLKRFLIPPIQAGLQAMSKLALRAQTVDIAYLSLRQGFFGKKRFNDRSKGFPCGQQAVDMIQLISTGAEALAG